MRIFSRIIILLIAASYLVLGQGWEVGGAAGFGVYRNASVTAGTASGSAGFGSGVALGGILGNRMNRWVSGEARYTYRSDDLEVSSGSANAKASAQSHAVHYDVLVHASAKDSAVRPFLAAGAGVKYYRGTGAEPVYQPLSNLVVLTHTSELQPLISVGGGVKFKVSRQALLRLDFRDYITPVPTNLLAAPPGSMISGWLHDFVFLVGVSNVF
jgi:hypothetical protein